nr:hypothetical protein [Pseudonocardia acidicola]
MIIDCDSCAVRGDACGDCVIGVLLGVPSPRVRTGEAPSGAPIVQFDAPEERALAVLADQGLVPKLRLVADRPRRASPDSTSDSQGRHVG